MRRLIWLTLGTVLSLSLLMANSLPSSTTAEPWLDTVVAEAFKDQATAP